MVGSGLNLLLYSVWLHEKMGDRHGETYFASHMKSVNLDLVLAFLLVGVVALIFMTLGFWGGFVREHLTEVGMDVVTETLLASFGKIPGGMNTVMFVAFIILTGALISGMDGRARAVSSVVSRASATRFDERTLYRMVLVAFAFIITAGILSGETMSLIQVVAAVSSVMFGLLGFMLIYLDRRLPVYARGGSSSGCSLSAAGVFFFWALHSSPKSHSSPLVCRWWSMWRWWRFSSMPSPRPPSLNVSSLAGGDAGGSGGWMILSFGLLSLYGVYRGGFFITGGSSSISLISVRWWQASSVGRLLAGVSVSLQRSSG
ncbi:hypothetical protein [Methanogenium cariaci]|uniref:hypothetical protein n=1 Tax=Methanogenium cariaci TaxID=2197 RepID=UPI001FE1DC3F|nr:hypothetical protein [Methanogenium cariaci]